MTAATRWVATGATAAMLTGGLFLGAPSAVAAPGDPACTAATNQFDAALAGAGLTPESLMALDGSADAVAAAEAQYTALVVGAGGPSLQELQAAAAALVAARESGDPAALAQAEARVAELDAALASALQSLDPAVVEQALLETAAAFESLLADLALDEATANQLLLLLEQVVVACEQPIAQPPVPAPVAPALPAPVAPVEAAPVEATPVELAPLPAAPAPEAPAGTVPVAVNPGLNMQTAAADAEQRSGTGLLAGLLTAGAAASAAASLVLRRRSRS